MLVIFVLLLILIQKIVLSIIPFVSNLDIIRTAVLPQNRSFDSVWSKIGTLQDCILLYKSTATPLPTLWFLITNESFQMRCYMNFFFKGHRNCQKSNLKVHEKSCFIIPIPVGTGPLWPVLSWIRLLLPYAQCEISFQIVRFQKSFQMKGNWV